MPAHDRRNMIDMASPDRRTALMGMASLFLALTGCIRGAEKLDGDWDQVGSNATPINHDVWDELLGRYAATGSDGVTRFAYGSVTAADHAALKGYLASLQAIRPQLFPRDEQFAYWVNLYNAATVELIVEAYPIKTIRDLGFATLGPWRKKILKVNDVPLSLDDVEHGILRPIWRDVRIHYTVNCASLGCPNLALKAWRADGLEAMLDDAARSFINHPRAFALKDGRLTASSIYDWYQADWGSAAEVMAHARGYAVGEAGQLLANVTDIDGYDYDWALNDRK